MLSKTQKIFGALGWYIVFYCFLYFVGIVFVAISGKVESVPDIIIGLILLGWIFAFPFFFIFLITFVLAELPFTKQQSSFSIFEKLLFASGYVIFFLLPSIDEQFRLLPFS